MFESALYETRPLRLLCGDILFVRSDGLTDAENPARQMFGTDCLLSTIGAEAPFGGEALKRGLLRVLDDFTPGPPQSDDITFLVVEKWQ